MARFTLAAPTFRRLVGAWVGMVVLLGVAMVAYAIPIRLALYATASGLVLGLIPPGRQRFLLVAFPLIGLAPVTYLVARHFRHVAAELYLAVLLQAVLLLLLGELSVQLLVWRRGEWRRGA